MKRLNHRFSGLVERLCCFARTASPLAKPTSVGGRHVIPLSELSVGLSVGSGLSADDPATAFAQPMAGTGALAAAGARAAPVAALLVENGTVRLIYLGQSLEVQVAPRCGVLATSLV
jgi:uncharacterized spore protein YtfJ